jgi:hypothetical protein
MTPPNLLEISAEDARRELESVLRSPTFERSERLQKFLQYVCDTGAPYGKACNSATTCVNDLNISSFALPAIGSFGNVGKGLLVGPNLINLDAGFVKSIPVRERMQVQLRLEFFNILNRANFNNPNNSVSGAGFGTILSAADPRIGQLALKAVF